MVNHDSFRGVFVKRKLREKSAPSRKKVKTHHTLDELPWKRVTRPLETGLGDDWILELEEVEGVVVEYDETERGRVARFKVTEDEHKMEQEGHSDNVSEPSPGDQVEDLAHLTTQIEEQGEIEDYQPFDSDKLLPGWHSFSLHPQLLRALYHKCFKVPTPIQAATLPVALKNKDVVGIAQTGSGKTLAYGLPILHYLLSLPRPPGNKRRQLRGLILAPTRELALQVSSHLNACLNKIGGEGDQELTNGGKAEDQTDGTESGRKTKGTEKTSKGTEKTSKRKEKTKTEVLDVARKKKILPHVSVATIVGGMSPQKQRRILERGVDILVATPGRLWDIIEYNDDIAREIKGLRFLVLDEADRMIETGHFAELDNILRLTLRGHKEDEIPGEFSDLPQEEDGVNATQLIVDGLQTFIFSATLSKDLQRNLKKRPKFLTRNVKGRNPASALDDLLLRLDFRDPEPEVIDLSPAGGVVSTLQESKFECLVTDKDAYLYYFLLRYPGRSLVFLSSIDGIRRLMPLTELLNIKAFPLHSQLEQRQRLKNLDRFKSVNNSVLLATDIAARGLDIPAVDHVIHYQVPRTADVYIHRNGRTARAMRKGFSLLMCAPDERKVVKALFGSLGRDGNEVPEMSVELSLLDKLKARVQLARQIDAAQHKVRKIKHDQRWMKETADVLGVELDSDIDSDLDGEKSSRKKQKVQDGKTAVLKAQLKQMLSQPLLARGISTKYITSGSKPIVDDLLAGDCESFLSTPLMCC
ncbi:hypothetical protein AX15_000394 [Amanita polypyramis BW_CC]|nr:hypothetical protein AX15_000394 [Amanita polypyramis BW_CC]